MAARDLVGIVVADAHFDVHLSIGAGAVGVDLSALNFSTHDVNVAGNIGIGFRIYLLDFLAVRFDYRQFFHASKKLQETGPQQYEVTANGLAKPAEFTIGLSFFTEAPE